MADETKAKLSAIDKATTGHAGASNMPFCETNPPFCDSVFVVSLLFTETYAVCRGDLQVGSFWKTNPPEGCFWVVFIEKWARFRTTNPLENRSVAWQSYFFFSPDILAITASSENAPGPKMRTITQVNRNKNGAAVTNASGLLKRPLILSGSAVKYATSMVKMSGTVTIREPNPSRSSSPPKHSVLPAMIAFNLGAGMFKLAKYPAVRSMLSSLPLPVRKNCQPQYRRMIKRNGDCNRR